MRGIVAKLFLRRTANQRHFYSFRILARQGLRLDGRRRRLLSAGAAVMRAGPASSSSPAAHPSDERAPAFSDGARSSSGVPCSLFLTAV